MRSRGCHAGGRFHWRCFPRVHAIAGCIGDGSGTCHLVIRQRGHLWFLHVSGSYWTTCRVTVVSHVSFLLAHVSWLDHVSLLHWTMFRIFIGPRGRFLFDHASWHCPSMFRIFIRPHGLTTSFHVSDF